MKADSLYRLAAACLITHEFDSIVKMTSSPNPFGSLSHLERSILIWGHIPIVLGLVFVAESTMSASVRYGTCVFAVIHVALHWVYRDQPIYDFGSMASWVLILLAGIFGAAYLVPAKAR
jgi:hypothetical protein